MKRERLETEKIWKLLTEFSIPAVTGMIVHSCYNIVSRIYIGNSSNPGIDGLAALGIAFPLILILFALCCLSGIGGTTLYSIKLGEKKLDEAEQILGNAIIIAVVTAVVSGIFIWIFSYDLLVLFGGSGKIIVYAKEYLSVFILGCVFGALSFTINAFVRADGSPNTAMLTMLIGAVVNIILTPLFIYIFKWGMQGAALATILGQFVTMCRVIAYFRSGKSSVSLTLKIIKPDFKLIKMISARGLSTCFMQFVNALVMVIMNKSLFLYGGDLAVSVMIIIAAIQTILVMPVVGLAQGAQPIIGYNFGAGRLDRVIETLKKSLIAATALVLTSYILIRIFPSQIISMFNNEQRVLDMGVHCMLIWILAIPVVGLQIMGSCYFQSIGKVMPSIITSLTRQLLLFIPAMLILPKFFGFEGILYSAPFSDFLSAVITGIWVWFDIKTQIKPKHFTEVLAG